MIPFRRFAALAVTIGTTTLAHPTSPPPIPLPLKILWIDNEADPSALSTTASVNAVVERAAAAGFNVVVPDTKNWKGIPFFDSRVTTRPAVVDGKPYPPDFDFLAATIAAARDHGLQVHAGINLFAEGAKTPDGAIGPFEAHPDWQAVLYDWSFHLNADGRRTTVSRVNDRGATGFSVFTPGFGQALAPRDAPASVIDGKTGSAASRWVSADTSATHHLHFAWDSPRRPTTATLVFPKGFPARAIELGVAAATVSAKDNSGLTWTLSLPATPAVDAGTTELQIRFTDPGGDNMARVEEVIILDASGRNIAPEAIVFADSTLARTSGVFAVVADGRITSAVSESSLRPSDLVAIPPGGFVIIAEDTASSNTLTSLLAASDLRLEKKAAVIPTSQHPRGALVYVNPSHPEVQAHNLRIIEEIVTRYSLAGVILDRGRYDNVLTDFSDLSRKQFESATKRKVTNWPEDIIAAPPDPDTGAPLKKGPRFDEWVAWRASVIRDFMVRARGIVSLGFRNGRHNPRIFGDYVGAWYGTYYEVGANWAHPNYDPVGDFEWATAAWRKGAYADQVNYLSPGVYYPILRKAGAPDPSLTVEGGIEMVQRVTAHKTRLAPGLYALGFNSADDYEAALRLCIEQASGVMVFSHAGLDKTGWWDATRRGLEAVPVFLE